MKIVNRALAILISLSLFITISSCNAPKETQNKTTMNTYKEFKLDDVTFLAPVTEKTTSQVININVNDVILPSFQGIGIEWDPYLWVDITPERWKKITDWIDFADIGLIRMMTNNYLFCLGFDAAGNPMFTWDNVDGKGNLIKNDNGIYVDKLGRTIPQNVKAMQKVYDIMDFCQKDGIDVLFGDWGYPAGGGNIKVGADYLQGVANKISYTDGRWQKMLAGYAKHLYTKYPNTAKFFDQGNEVNLVPDSYELNAWTDSIKTLYKEFQNQGIVDKVKIVGPDAGFTNDLWLQPTLNVLGNEVSALDYHDYYNKNGVSNDILENASRLLKNTISRQYPNKPLFYTEVGYSAFQNAAYYKKGTANEFNNFFVATAVADAAVQFTRAGVDSHLLWMIDDMTHLAWGKQPNPTKPEKDIVFKYGGLWNSFGANYDMPEAENPRPMYYTWATLSRAFPKGSKIIQTNNPQNQAARTLAATFDTKKGKEISFALVNSSDVPITVTFKCDDVLNNVDLLHYEYTENSIPKDENLLPKAKETIKDANLREGVEITLPASGTAVLTTKDTKSVVKLNENQNHINDYMGGLNNMYAHSDNLGFNSYKAIPKVITGDLIFDNALYNGDATRIHKSDNNKAFVTYNIANLKDFRVGFYQNYGISGGIRAYTSVDNKNWTLIDTTKILRTTVSEGIRYNMLIPTDATKIPVGTNFVKIELDGTDTFNDTQLTFFEGANEKLSPLSILGTIGNRVYVKPNAAFTLNEKVKIKFSGEYVGEFKVKWDAVNKFDKEGTYRVKGIVDKTDVTVYAEVYVQKSIADQFDDYSLMLNTPLNVRQVGAWQINFMGDLTQLVRSDELQPAILDYRLFGAKSLSANLFLNSPQDDPTSYIKIYTSSDGVEFKEALVKLTAKKENDSTGVYGENNEPNYNLSQEVKEKNKAWPLYTFTADNFPDNTNYVRIELTAKKPQWVQQFASLEIK